MCESFGNSMNEEQYEIPVWWVLRTKPRSEKKMGEWMSRKGTEIYLPLRKRTRFYRGKKVDFMLPLFPGYVFAKFPAVERISLYDSFWLLKTIMVNDQDRFLMQLDPIRKALEMDAPLEACAYMEKGVRVRVASGKFKGLEGVVQKRKNQNKLVLTVDILQRAVSLEVDMAMLEVIA